MSDGRVPPGRGKWSRRAEKAALEAVARYPISSITPARLLFARRSTISVAAPRPARGEGTPLFWQFEKISEVVIVKIWHITGWIRVGGFGEVT